MTSAHLAAGPVPTVAAWDNPPAVAPRGTVILIAGRGEHPGLYERFGTRIAFDGYRVRVVGDPTAHGETVASQVERLSADPDLPAPRVLAGSDAGAAFAAALVATGKVRVDGLILAGLPGGEATTMGIGEWEWGTELGERTACPAHQARLDADISVRRGALTVPVPRSWIVEGDLRRVTVPVLGLHGTADLLSPLPAARERYAGAPVAEFVTIDGGKHDALNDASHRTAAAVVVLFLERLRAGADLPEIARWTSWS